MDIATVVGIAVGALLMVGSILVGGGNLRSFVDIPSVFIVLGGSVAAVMICFPIKEFLNLFSVLKKVFFNEQRDLSEIINGMIALSETARRDGILALEERLEEIKDPFLVLGLRMSIDGMSPEVVESVMRTEMDAVDGRHEVGKSILTALGTYAPAFGMMGTVVGLVVMLGDMDPETLGAGMAVALLTTLYGALVANLFCLPVASKLNYYGDKELLAMEITIRGVIAIQSGENPRVIEQKLSTFIPPKLRKVEEAD